MSTSKSVTVEAQASSESCINGPLQWTLVVIGIILGIALFLFLLRKFIQGPFYRKKNRIDGKVVIITGCNTGIGKETALELARRGGKIYMACRDPVRCEGARLEIIEKTKNENVFNRTLDLGSLESVRKFAEKFNAEESQLDILINNAGVMATAKGSTANGFDLQFGINHLGHFLLTNLLLDTLKQSAPSRIVVVSSIVYTIGRIHKDDLNYEKSYSKLGSYSQSKLANILFTRKLCEKLHGTNVTANCLHPGLVKTELGRHIISEQTRSILDPLTNFLFKSPKAGAQTTLRLALDPSLEKSSGGFYLDTFKVPLLPHAKNKEMADWLWSVSEELVGLKAREPTTIVPVTLQVPTTKDTSDKRTTVIEMGNNDEITDNRKLEEKMYTVNDILANKEVKGTKEHNDQPEKEDKPEKAQKLDTADDINQIDVEAKLEKVHKDIENTVSKTNGEITVAWDVTEVDIANRPKTPTPLQSLDEKLPGEEKQI